MADWTIGTRSNGNTSDIPNYGAGKSLIFMGGSALNGLKIGGIVYGRPNSEGNSIMIPQDGSLYLQAFYAGGQINYLALSNGKISAYGANPNCSFSGVWVTAGGLTDGVKVKLKSVTDDGEALTQIVFELVSN